MPALVAVRHNRQIREAYGRICQKHPKEKMIGVAAAMRRLLMLIYTLWKNGEEYDETRDKTHTPNKNGLRFGNLTPSPILPNLLLVPI